MRPIVFRAAILAATLPVLNGCVAAIIPVVASGALIGKEQLESDDEQREGVVAVEDSAAVEPATAPSPTPTPIAVAEEPIAEVQVAEAPVEELPTSQTSGSSVRVAEIERPAPDFVGPVDTEQSGMEPSPSTPIEELAAATVPETTIPAERPASEPLEPAMATPPAPMRALPTSPTDFRAYDALYSYVESQARRDPVSSPRQSAVLAVPGALSPKRVDCSIRPPAIVFDLDRSDQPIDPAITPRANPALGQILMSLRLQEIEVFWISEQPAIVAGDIRKALIAGGLDPQGRDGLLLMRSANDRKQTRRKELSQTHCLLAIGGDRRADFDELYLYLKDQTAAQPLEELIGAGWFLTPLPLTEGP